MAYEQVDLAGVTFRDFIDNKAANGEPGNFSFVLRGYVRKWMSEIDAQLEKLKPVQELVRGERGRGAATAAGGRSRRQGLIWRQCRRSGKLPDRWPRDSSVGIAAVGFAGGTARWPRAQSY